MVTDQIDKVAFGKNPLVKIFSENGVAFVGTYHPKVRNPGKLIKDLLPFLYRDKDIVEMEVFSTPPIAPYRNDRKIIKDYIVRSK